MPKPLILIPFKDDEAPFPLAQGSSSVTNDPNDDAIQIEKRRTLLDGDDEDDNEPDDTDADEHGKGKDIPTENTVMAEDDTESAAKITTPSKTQEVTKRTSTRGRPIGSGNKKGCSPPHILFLFINHLLIRCLFLSRPQVSYGKIPGVGQFSHV